MLLLALYGDTHGTGGTGDDLGSCRDVVGVEVFHLGGRNLFDLRLGQLGNLDGVRSSRTLGDACSLLDELCGRRGLGDEGEGTVFVNRDFNRDNVSALGFRCSVVRLAEFHDVDTVLAKRRTDRRSRVSGTSLDLQVDEAGDLLFGSKCRVLLSIASWDTGARPRLVAPMARRPAASEPQSRRNGSEILESARSW